MQYRDLCRSLGESPHASSAHQVLAPKFQRRFRKVTLATWERNDPPLFDVFLSGMATEESQGLPWAAWDPAKTNADILCSDAAGPGDCASHRARNTETACSRTYGVPQGRTRPGSSTTSTTRGYATKKRRLSRSITLHHPYHSVPNQAQTRLRTRPLRAMWGLAAPRSGPKNGVACFQCSPLSGQNPLFQ